MQNRDSRRLKAAHVVLRIGLVLSALMALMMVVGLVMSFVSPAGMTVGKMPGVPGLDATHPMAKVMQIAGLAFIAMVGPALLKLLRVVDAARAGDPFTRENGARLRGVGWLLLGAQVMATFVHTLMLAAVFNIYRLDLVPWMGLFIALLFFVIAHVFDQGAEMRSEIEGTV